jgi:hypothetical protein
MAMGPAAEGSAFSKDSRRTGTVDHLPVNEVLPAMNG